MLSDFKSKGLNKALLRPYCGPHVILKVNGLKLLTMDLMTKRKQELHVNRVQLWKKVKDNDLIIPDENTLFYPIDKILKPVNEDPDVPRLVILTSLNEEESPLD